jgi:pimeloyl-ACP methyl ester carboxylesterase
MSTSIRRALVTGLALLALLISMLFGTTPMAEAAPVNQSNADLPIVFVHGFNGSGAQYETQALRWASSRYRGVVTAIDQPTPLGDIFAELDEFFSQVMADTGSDQIYVIAHSRGTFIMYQYLASSPERAAQVAKYIGIDGLSNESCPGEVECRGIWGRGPTTRVLGTDNVYLSDQGHTESVTSPESFEAQYEFLTGRRPRTTEIVPDRSHRVEISGKVLSYPANSGIDGANLEIWEVSTRSGKRRTKTPLASFQIDETGEFSPVKVSSKKRYELAVIRTASDGATVTNHFYYEPWIRDNHLLRLNLAPLDSALSNAVERGPHTTASVIRQREWWGANPIDPDDTDDLLLSTRLRGPRDQAPLDIVNGNTAPYEASTIAMIVFDVGVDQASDVSQLFELGPFLSGIDTYMPASAPPDGTVSFELHQRGFSDDQVIKTPNWSSEERHSLSITFRDWEEDRRRHR